jgi:hypothetical protein
MARVSASDKTKKFYRAVIAYTFVNPHNGFTQPRRWCYGPYSAESTAKGLLTRELKYLQRNPNSYRDLDAWVEETDLVWSKV